MKQLSILTVLPVFAIAAIPEEIPPQIEHQIVPYVAYRNQGSNIYEYSFVDTGLEYRMNQKEGLNIHLGVANSVLDFNKHDRDNRTESYLKAFFKFRLDSTTTLSPFFQSQATMHSFTNMIGTDISLLRPNLGIGFRLEKDFRNALKVSLTLEATKEPPLNVWIATEEKDVFVGKKFHYPMGYRVTPAVSWEAKEGFTLEASGFYAQTLRVGYLQRGAQLSFVWSI